MTDSAARLMEAGLVPILRVDRPDVALAAGEAMAAAGLRAVEVTASVPGAEEVIARLSERLDGTDVLLGAGTVLSAEQAERFVAAGARFLVSPVLDPVVVEAARRLGVPHVPSGFTPTELLTAVRAGAPLVKLFPAGPVGPAYVRALLGPFPDMALMPTGGLDEESGVAFIRSGARAVGIGGALCPRTLEEVEPAARAAARVLARIDEARGTT